jgi:signal transduction histidine kinase
VALDAASVGLTVLVAWFAMRALRSHIALLRQHNQLLTARADELEIFAGRVAHDIRNPISTATLSLARLQRLVANDAKLAQSARRGLSSLERASRILDGLLAFARGGARPEPGAVSEVASVVPMLLDDLRPVATDARIQLDYEPPPGSCAVACDTSILEVLLSNLVRNAIKYMGDGPQRKVTVRIRDLGEVVRFEVADTGSGIPPDRQHNIFAPFVRGETYGQPGVGLGLATVKRICDAHGGRVGVQSNAGGGSCFWFELPKPRPRQSAPLTHGKLEFDS